MRRDIIEKGMEIYNAYAVPVRSLPLRSCLRRKHSPAGCSSKHTLATRRHIETERLNGRLVNKFTITNRPWRRPRVTTGFIESANAVATFPEWLWVRTGIRTDNKQTAASVQRTWYINIQQFRKTIIFCWEKWKGWWKKQCFGVSVTPGVDASRLLRIACAHIGSRK